MRGYPHALVLNFFVFIGIIVICVSNASASGAPPYLNYQGTLNDDQGNPFSGNATMVFRIYGAIDAAPADALWDSGQVEVLVNNGRFSLTLGDPPQDPISPSLFSGSERYLGVSVDGTELIPRKRMLSVPYAMNSGIPSGAIIMWSGSVANIPAGWALCDGSNGTPNLQNRFIVGAGGSYSVGSTGGENSHTLTKAEMPSHNHTVNPPATNTNNDTHSHGITDPGHTHNIWSENITREKGGYNDDVLPGGKEHYEQTESAKTKISIENDTHNHSVDINQFNSGSTDGGSSHENRPPYYSLCFIMKI